MDGIVYRPLPESDHEQFARLEAHAFNLDLAEIRRGLEEDGEQNRRGLYAGGRLVAVLAWLPLQVQAGRGELPCGGIAGVVVPPEQRRQGYTARLLREACDELLAQGVRLSMLHPFKTSFYRRFGWAGCVEHKVYHGAPELLASFLQRQHGHFEPVGPEAIPELHTIYSGALRGRFGVIARTPLWWRLRVFGSGDHANLAYIWRDSAGAGRAYLLCRLGKGPQGRTLHCREAVALDPTAREQLFALMAQHDSQCHEVVFRAPPDAPINALMPDPLECTIEPHFMVRLLDVRALGDSRYPSDVSGRLTIAVSDDWLDHNQGVFELEVAGGAAQCRRLPDDAEADLACDVRVLAQLFSRYLRPRSAAAFGLLDVRSRSALELADRLFNGLSPFSSDFF